MGSSNSAPWLQPWSPVGYRVVEVLDGPKSSDAAPPQVILAEAVGQSTKCRAPRSPVGYRVTLISEEIVPAPRPARGIEIRAPRRRRSRPSMAAIWIPMAAIAVIVLLPAVALCLMISSRPRPQWQPPVVAVAVPNEMVVVPDAIRALPAEKPAEDAAPPEAAAPAVTPRDAKEACPDCDPFDIANQAGPRRPARPDREGFATAVEFVRNPQEAKRLAKTENKLTFILHLSGNFEDPGFT